jgi:MFS family permease
VVGAFAIGMAACYLLFGRMMEWFSWPGAFVVAGIGTAGFMLIWAMYAADQPYLHPSVNTAERELIEGPRLFVPPPVEPKVEAGEADPRLQSPSPYQAATSAELGAGSALGVPARSPDLEDASAHLQAAAPRKMEDMPSVAIPESNPAVTHDNPFLRKSEVGSLFANASLICLTLSYGAVSYMQYLFFYWIQYYFESVLHLGTEVSRLGSTALVLAMGVGMIGGGFLADRVRWQFGPHRQRALVPVAGMVVSALALVAGLLAPVTEVTICLFALAMLALGTSEGSFWTAATELGGPRGGMAAGILNTGGNGGGLIAPIVTPLFSSYFGWKAGIGLASVVCLVGAALWYWVDLRGDAGQHSVETVNEA